MERNITSRKVSKFKRRFGDGEKHLQDVVQKPIITKRDKEALMSVYYHRCLTTEQLAEIHYSRDRKGKENSQYLIIARRRLRQMFDYQLIDRFFVDVGYEGSSQGHIVLDQLGAKMVAGLLNVELDDLMWRYDMNEARLPYLQHTVDVNNFFLYLLRKARELGHEATGFRTETHCRHEFKYWGKRTVCNPDAYGQYWAGDEGFHFLLEWDNGTMSPLVFQKKQPRYAAFYDSGAFEPLYSVFPLILTVAPSEERVEALRKVIFSVDRTDLNWLFTTKKAAEENVLGPIWLGKDENPVSLI